MADTPQSSVASAVEASRQAQSNESAVTTPSQEQVLADNKSDIFARKERQIRQMQRQLQADKQAWEAEKTKYATEYIPKSRVKEDPLAVLAEEGLTTDKLTEMLLNAQQSQDPAVRALAAEIKALKQQQSDAQKKAEEATTQQYQQALKQITNEVKMMVDGDVEFDSIKQAGLYDAVVELIEQTFNDTGVLMEVKDACTEVENYLVEEALKMAQLRKVKERLQPKQEEATPAEPTQKQTQQLKTLTNSVSQQSPRRSSEKERKERAIAAFYGKLNT